MLPVRSAGAHKLVNQSDSTARTLMFSSSQVPAVSVYPDSNKIGVWPRQRGRRACLQARYRRAVVGWRGRLGVTSSDGLVNLVIAIAALSAI